MELEASIKDNEGFDPNWHREEYLKLFDNVENLERSFPKDLTDEEKTRLIKIDCITYMD